MKSVQNIYTPIRFSNYNLLSLLCSLIGKLEITLLNGKVKVVNSCEKNMDLNNCGSKLVGYRHFFLYKYLCNNCNTIFLTGARMKPPKEINHLLVECN